MAAASPPAARKSTARALLLSADPTYLANWLSVGAWSRALWRLTPGWRIRPQLSRGIMSVAFYSERRRLGASPRWAAVTGPTGGLLCTLHRMGWHPLEPFLWLDEFGAQIKVDVLCPGELVVLVRRSSHLATAAHLADSLGYPAIRHGFHSSVRRVILGTSRGLSRSQRAVSRAWFVDGIPRDKSSMIGATSSTQPARAAKERTPSSTGSGSAPCETRRGGGSQTPWSSVRGRRGRGTWDIPQGCSQNLCSQKCDPPVRKLHGARLNLTPSEAGRFSWTAPACTSA
jgi:hypothetical protein